MCFWLEQLLECTHNAFYVMRLDADLRQIPNHVDIGLARKRFQHFAIIAFIEQRLIIIPVRGGYVLDARRDSLSAQRF